MYDDEVFGGSTVNKVEVSTKPVTAPVAPSVAEEETQKPVMKFDAIKAAPDDATAPEGNHYSDEDKKRVKDRYGDQWGKMSWFDQQRALAHDQWFHAVDTGAIDDDTFLDGIFDDPEVEKINKREENFLHALKNAMSQDVSRLSDDEAQGYFMDLVEADPRFGFKDDVDGTKMFGAEAEYGKGNLSRLLSVYKGVNPNGLFSREAQRWLDSNEAQKIAMAKEDRGLKDTIFEMFDTDQEVVKSHEKRLMAKERAVQFATLMGGLSPAGQEVVLASIKADEVDERTLRFLDTDERETALAAYRCAKKELDANWWLTQGVAKFSDTLGSVAGGSWRMLKNAYWQTGGRNPVGSKQLKHYEDEQLMQLQIEDAERTKYKDNLTFLGDVASGLIGTIPYMAAMSNPYTGALASLGMANDARERMILSGVDQSTALAISLPVGIIEGWIEKLQWEKAFGCSLSEFAIRSASMIGIAKQIAKKRTMYTGANLLKMGKAFAVTTITEDCEEVLQQLTEDLGVSLATGDFNIREIAEDMWDTAVESFPTTFGFGLLRASGVGPSIRRRFSRRSVTANDFKEYVQSKQAASNVLKQMDATGAQHTPDANKEAILDDFRVRWNKIGSSKGRIDMLCDSGLNSEQAAIVDNFFRLENDFFEENPVFSYYDESGHLVNHFEMKELPSLMKGVKSVAENGDGTWTLELKLDRDTTAKVKVERVDRTELVKGNEEQFEKQVRMNYEEANPGKKWEDLDENGRRFYLGSATPGGITKVTIADTTIPYDAIIKLAAPNALGVGGAQAYEVGHEIFHAAIRIGLKMGILTEEDIDKMRKVFGAAKAEGYFFNEEDAADDYGKVILDGNKYKDLTVGEVFGKIRDFFKRIYNAFTNRNGNEMTELNTKNIFDAIRKGDLRGISALSGIAVNAEEKADGEKPKTAAEEESVTKSSEPATETTSEPATETTEAAPTVKASVPGVADIEAEVVEVPVASLATKDDPDFDQELAETAPVIVNSEPVDGIPVVVGGGNVLAGSDTVNAAKRSGKDKVKVKRVRKVKTAKKPAKKAKKEKKPFDIFNPQKSIAEMSAAEQNKFRSVRRFIDVHGGAFPCLSFWIDHGRRMFAKPDKSAKINDYLELLSTSDRMFLARFGKGGTKWDELPSLIGMGMEEMEPEEICDRALAERQKYIEWKDRGCLTPEQEEQVYNHDLFISEGHTEAEWLLKAEASAPSSAPAYPEVSGKTDEEIEEIIKNDEANGVFSIKDTLSLLNDIAENDILFNRPADALFSLRLPVEQTKNLIALHNMRENAVKPTADLGGFAIPSIAIVKTSYGHDEFGEISVLFGKDTIDPKKNRANRIFSHDAWTATFPKINNKIDLKAIDKVNGRLLKMVDPDIADALHTAFYYLSDNDGIRDKWDTAVDASEAYYGNEILKAAYLASKGEKVKPVMREKRYLGRSTVRAGIIGEDGLKRVYEEMGKELIDIEEGPGAESSDRYEKIRPRLEDLARDIVYERDYRNDPDAKGFSKDELVGHLLNGEKSHFTFSDMDAIARACVNLDYDIKRGKSQQEVDKYATENMLRERVKDDDAGFNAWVNKQYGNPILGRGVYNGKDRYDYAGRPRSWSALHYEATLENIVKAMKKVQKEHGGGILGSNPFGVAAKKFSSLKDVITNKGILRELTDGEEKAIKDALGNRLMEVVMRYRDTQKHPDDNHFTALSRAEEALYDAYTTHLGSFDAMKKELNGWGYEADDDLVRDFIDVMNDISLMPTNYFEAKPQRAVRFDEPKAWIVPDTVKPETLKILDGNGQRIYKYRAGDKADRLRVTNQAASDTESLFSLRKRRDPATIPSGKQKDAAVIYPSAAEEIRGYGVETSSRLSDSIDKLITDADGKAQMKQVLKAYTNRDGSFKPGFGKVVGDVTRESRLAPLEWLKVRTENFRNNFFGDWLSLKRRQLLNASPVVKIANTSGISYDKSRRSEIKRQLLTWARETGFGGFYDTEVGQIEIDYHSVKTSFGHPRWGEAKFNAIFTLPEGFKNAVYLGSLDDQVHGNSINHYFAYRADNGGTPSIVFCRAQEDINKNRLYLHEIYTEEEMKKSGTVKPGAINDALTDSSAFGRIILNPLFTVNPDSVSKVVDENGEPMVVYRGITANGNDIDYTMPEGSGQYGPGVYFTESEDLARGYAGPDGKVFACFVKAQKFAEYGKEVDDILGEVEVDDRGTERDVQDFDEHPESVRKLVEAGYDGFIDDGNGGFVLWNHKGNIKSATDNTGAFSASNPNILFSIRRDPPPTKTGIGYKVFVQKRNPKTGEMELYPPMVANPDGAGTPIGPWLDADEGRRAEDSKTGRAKVKAGGKGTNGSGGTLAWRPGWHLGKIPYALQFNVGEKVPNPLGIKNKKGEVIEVGKYFPANFVWAEVEYAADEDYQEKARAYGINANGNYEHAKAGLPYLPVNGSYEYRTNPNPATDPWIITGAMRVKKVLTPDEVDEIVRAAGREPQLREDRESNAFNGGVSTLFSLGNRAREDAKSLIMKKRADLRDMVNSHYLTRDEVSEIFKEANDDQEKVKDIALGRIADKIVDEIAKFPNTKSQKAALHWFIKGAIRLPEDAPKVTEAIAYTTRANGKANTDPMAYDSPMAMIDALHDFKPKAKAINPDKVPQLSDRREMGHGITTYLVQDDREGQQAMREIINTHWGEDANPWCLLHGDGHGHLSDGSNGGYDAWHYWNHYNALPKRVAFKDGKLLAFMATDENSGGYPRDDYQDYLDENGLTEEDIDFETWQAEEYHDVPEQWWDRQDKSHEGIPLGNIPVPNDPMGRSADINLMKDGSLKPEGNFHKETDTEKIWWQSGDILESYREIFGKDKQFRRDFHWNGNGSLLAANFDSTVKGINGNDVPAMIQSKWNDDGSLREIAFIGNNIFFLDNGYTIEGSDSWFTFDRDGKIVEDETKFDPYTDRYGNLVDREKMGTYLWSVINDLRDKAKAERKRAEDTYAKYTPKPGESVFSVHANPNLRSEIDAALNTDRETGSVEKGGRHIVFCDSPTIFRFLGIPDGKVYSRVYTVRKIANDHLLTAEQISSAPNYLSRPVAVFDDKGGYVFLTDAVAPDEEGRTAPVMFYLRPDGNGNYIASAYARRKSSEAKYSALAKSGGLLYIDKNKAALLPLKGEARSSLITFSEGDNVKTAEGFSSWSSANSIPQSEAVSQGGIPALVPSTADEVVGSVRFDKDPEDVIAGMIATKTRRGERMTINEVQQLLAMVGRDPSLGAELLRRGQSSGNKIGNIIKRKVVDDDTFLDLATTEAKRSRLLKNYERIGEEGYRLGVEDERNIAALGKAKEEMVNIALQNATGFGALSMEMKYGFNIVKSVMNAHFHPTPKPTIAANSLDKPGEVNGPGMSLDEMNAAEEAKKQNVVEVEARESAALTALKNKAAKRADQIDAEYGLTGGESPAQKQAQAEIDANAGSDAGGGEGAENSGKVDRRRIKREQLDFNRASDFLAFVEELICKELGVEKIDTPFQVRQLANTAKFFLEKIARQLCYSNARELIMRDLDHIADQVSLKAVEASVMNTYSRIQERLIPEKQEELIKKLEYNGRMIAEKGYFFSRGGDERERKVRAAVEEWWRMVKSYLRLDSAAVEQERNRLKDIIEKRTEISDRERKEGNPFVIDQDLRYRMAVDCLNALTQYGGLINKTPGEIADKSEEILAQLKGSRAELENAREDNRIQMRTISERIKRAVFNPKAAESGKAPKPGWFVRMLDSMMGVLEVRMRDLIRYSHGEVRRKAEADLQNIEDAIALGSQTFNVLKVDAQREFEEVMKRIYGSSDKGVRRLTEFLDDADRKAIAKQSSTDAITRSWLLQRYVELAQTDDYAVNIAVNKRDGKWRERFDEIFKKYISDDDLTFLVWMRNWYRKNLTDLNEKVLVPISGIKQYSPGENYFPVKMRMKTRQGTDTKAKAWSPLPSWLTPRVSNDLDFDERTDLLTMWFSRMRESAGSIAYAKLGLNLTDILLNPGFKDAVADNHGEVALKRLTEHITDIISGGGSALDESDDSIALADRLRAWQTNLTLSCNYVSSLKQMTSCPVYALRHDIDFGMVWKFITNVDYGSIRKLMASDGWKSRYGNGLSEAMQNAMRVNSKNGSAATNFLHHLYNSGFAVMEFGDSVPCVWVGQGLFRYFVAKIRDTEGGSATMTEAEIEEKAMTRTWAIIEMTQQSKRTENLTAMQRSGSGMGRFLYQFLSSPVQQLAYEVQAVREALAARGTDHAKEANKHLYRVLVVNHLLMPNFLYLASVVAGLPLGKIPDKDSMYWDFFLQTLLGQYGCIFLAGAVAEGTIDGLINGKFDYRNDGLPVNGIIDLFKQLGVDVHDLLTWNNDEFAADAIRSLKLLGAPTRHAATAYENWATKKGEKKRKKNLRSWSK